MSKAKSRPQAAFFARVGSSQMLFSAPSMRGLSPIGDWGSFALCKNAFLRKREFPSPREVKKIDCARMRATDGRPYD